MQLLWCWLRHFIPAGRQLVSTGAGLFQPSWNRSQGSGHRNSSRRFTVGPLCIVAVGLLMAYVCGESITATLLSGIELARYKDEWSYYSMY